MVGVKYTCKGTHSGRLHCYSCLALTDWLPCFCHISPQVVDVNYTCKGTQSGGLYRYSCMVVVGNGDGVLGWGIGKAAETADAVQKAYMRACK